MTPSFAEPMEGIERDQSTRGVFLDALDARREAILAELYELSGVERIAEFVFDLLSHLAINEEAEFDDELVDSFARRHDIDADAVSLSVAGGGSRSLRDVLLSAEALATTVHAINALFTLGYRRKLEPQNPVERRNFTLRVVAMLPGVERIGPFVLTDFLDAVCDEEDALRFWQIYVDRIAAEVDKRSRARDQPTSDPWLIARLLRLHEDGPSPARSAGWIRLTRHVNRVMQARRYRWRFIRHLVEGCHDVRLLHYVCTCPAMVEDADVLPVFLGRGDSRLVSCALFTLYIYGDSHPAVEATLQQLRARPFAELAPRIVEIYGQLHVPLEPGPALTRLARGLLAIVLEGLREAPFDVLAGAMAEDARSLRQCTLLADVCDAGAEVDPNLRQRLLERGLTTFFQTFTPSGIAHPLNDQRWRETARRILRHLVENDPEGVRQRLEAFGLGLRERARKWIAGDDDDSARERARLVSRFVGVLADTVLGVCRTLYARPESREAALVCYRTLVRVYLAHHREAYGSGWFGAVEYVLPALFPDLAPEGDAEAQQPAGRISEAAELIAQTEHALWPPRSENHLTLAGQYAGAGHNRDHALAVPPLMRLRPSREAPLRAPARLTRRSSSRLRSVFRAYTGVDLALDLGRRLLRLLGYRQQGELKLTDREIVVTSESTLMGQKLGYAGYSHAVDDIVSVRVVQPMRLFYLATGLGGLLTSGVLGGHLVFVGLRGAESLLLLLGGGVLGLGLLFDAAMTRLFDRNRDALVLELRAKGAPRYLRLVLQAESGAAVLDAFMAYDAERRELEILEEWAAMEHEWEGELPALDLEETLEGAVALE